MFCQRFSYIIGDGQLLQWSKRKKKPCGEAWGIQIQGSDSHREALCWMTIPSGHGTSYCQWEIFRNRWIGGTDSIRSMFQGYVRGYTSKIWSYMVQYLHFRILEFPLILCNQPINQEKPGDHCENFSGLLQVTDGLEQLSWQPPGLLGGPIGAIRWGPSFW